MITGFKRSGMLSFSSLITTLKDKIFFLLKYIRSAFNPKMHKWVKRVQSFNENKSFLEHDYTTGLHYVYCLVDPKDKKEYKIDQYVFEYRPIYIGTANAKNYRMNDHPNRAYRQKPIKYENMCLHERLKKILVDVDVKMYKKEYIYIIAAFKDKQRAMHFEKLMINAFEQRGIKLCNIYYKERV